VHGPSLAGVRIVAAALAGRMTSGGAVLVGDVLIVPGELLAELLVPLRAHHDACRGVTAPPASVQPRWSPTLHHLTEVASLGAIAYRQRTRATHATSVIVAQSPSVTPSALSPRRGGTDGEGAISVARAAEILGVSRQFVRVLAASGGLAARKRRCRRNGQSAARMQWEIDVDSCHAYRAYRQGVA
jgi:hypothetical protein